MTRAPLTLALCLCLTLAACGSTPTQRTYTLQPPSTPALEANTGAASRPSLWVGPVTLPEAVDRPQIVTLSGAQRVHVSDTHRWAEPLKAALPRLLAHQLTQALPGTLVRPYDQPGLESPAGRVTLDILRLDLQPGQAATLDTLWALQRPGQPLLNGQLQISEKPTDDSYPALVEALQRALARLSRELALQLRYNPSLSK